MITFDLSDLERSMSRSFRFSKLISYKGTELGHMLLLNINRKPYMGSPMTLSHLTLRGQYRGRSDIKGVRLYVTIEHQQEITYGKSKTAITFDLEWP